MTLREDDISVLIRSYFYRDVAAGSVTCLTPQITAVETHLGWTIHGSLRNLTQGSGEHATSLFIAIEDTSERDAALEAGVNNCWRLDSLEFQDDPDGSQGNSMALELFERAISKVGERYEVPLLIQEPGLDNEQGNYILAKQRLLIQLHRFRPQPDFLARYEDTLKAYFNDYHAEQVPDEDITPKPNTYYMPHQIPRDAVITKLRVVFDASSHALDQPPRTTWS
ncbi:uncharacterized protein LOC142774323 [Rhipicephalus microplus]|uniref:uncharacterized protein LOC142774323 n=1 Tax=Rhipicephalus microplus TaxID=6941 RepID=UPI003F6D6D70